MVSNGIFHIFHGIFVEKFEVEANFDIICASALSILSHANVFVCIHSTLCVFHLSMNLTNVLHFQLFYAMSKVIRLPDCTVDTHTEVDVPTSIFSAPADCEIEYKVFAQLFENIAYVGSKEENNFFSSPKRTQGQNNKIRAAYRN